MTTATASHKTIVTGTDPSDPTGLTAAQAPVVALSVGTPTVAQFLDAATAEYVIAPTNPPGMTPFLVNGSQLQLADEGTGAFARVWLTGNNQVVIAYQGTTGGENLLTNPLAVIPQLVDDLGLWGATTWPAVTSALAFAKSVVAIAAGHGIGAANVFVTGHSLGGIEAEYVAQQTGLGGMSFEATGLAKSVTTAGNGANFVNVITAGDPVGSYASDVKGEQPFAPAYAPGMTGASPHYGSVVMVGDPAAETKLTADAAGATNPLGTLFALPALMGDLNSYHMPGAQAYALGVTPYDPIIDSFGVKSGPVLAAANDTIPQFQALAAAMHLPG
jgi:hypothetical protein